MTSTVERLLELGQGQRVRLTLADAGAIEVRVNQMEYVPEECIHVELTTDTAGDSCRYRVEAGYERNDWTPLSARRYDGAGDAWTDLGVVGTVTPLETFVTVKSTDMEAQAGTGGRGPRP